MSQTTPEHNVNLRVLRLQTPSYHSDAHPVPADDMLAYAKQRPQLALPVSFGTCCLGETFSALITACNDSPIPVYAASLRVEIHTPSVRQILGETTVEEGAILQPGDFVRVKMDYEIKESASHALTCYVSYQPSSEAQEEPRVFRKIYKFQTINPLSVKTKSHTSRSPFSPHLLKQRDTTYLEVQVQNLAQNAFSFQSLTFEPAEGMECLDPNVYPDSLALLSPQDIRQFLYILKPREPKTIYSAWHQGVLVLGKLNIIWAGPMGETGRLTTAQLTRKIAPPPLWSSLNVPSQDGLQYDLGLDDQPGPVKPHQPFTLDFMLFITPLRQFDGRTKSVHLVVQHVDYSKTPKVEADLASAINKNALTTPPGPSTPVPRQGAQAFPPPIPFSRPNADLGLVPSRSLLYLGPPLQHLAAVELPPSWSPQRPRDFSVASSVASGDTNRESEGEHAHHVPLAVPVSMRYAVLEPGLAVVGGLRVLVVGADGSVKRVAEFEGVAQVLAQE